MDKITDLLRCEFNWGILLKGSEYGNIKSYGADENVGFLKAVFLRENKLPFN